MYLKNWARQQEDGWQNGLQKEKSNTSIEMEKSKIMWGHPRGNKNTKQESMKEEIIRGPRARIGMAEFSISAFFVVFCNASIFFFLHRRNREHQIFLETRSLETLSIGSCQYF